MTSTNKFSEYRDENSFSSVESLVENCMTHLQKEFQVSESDLTESEKGTLSDLVWDDLDRQSEHPEWVTFTYDNTIVKVYVYGEYSQSGENLVKTKVIVRLYESDKTYHFRINPDGEVYSTE